MQRHLAVGGPVGRATRARRAGVRRWRRERADLPRAAGRRRAGRPARPPPRPRLRRAGPARPRRRPRPRAAPPRRHAARAAAAARLARLPLVRRAARRLSRPGDVRTPPTRSSPASTTSSGSAPASAPSAPCFGGFSMGSVMSYSLGLGADRPAPAGILAFSGFVPVVEGWEPDLAGRPARASSSPTAAATRSWRSASPGAPASCSRAAASTSTTTSPTPATTSTRRTCRAAIDVARRDARARPGRRADDRGLAGAAVRRTGGRRRRRCTASRRSSGRSGWRSCRRGTTGGT